MLHQWVYIAIVIVLMAFFLLGLFVGRITKRAQKPKPCTKHYHKSASKRVTQKELDGIGKVLSQGRTILEAKRYARANCPNYHLLSDEDYKILQKEAL